MYRPGTLPRGTTAATIASAQTALLNGVALPYPIEMVIDATGQPFTGLVVGDWPGHSPSVLGAGSDGKLAIGSFAELTVTDSRVLPNQLGYTIRARAAKTTASATPTVARSRSRTRSRRPAAATTAT